MKPGQQVRVISAPDRIGILTDNVQVIEGRKRWIVQFPDNRQRFPEKNLEIIDDVETTESLLSSGKYGEARHLRGAITHARLTGQLANVIYSMEATNTEYYPYQFKPVLNFLQSPCNGILIADEVGLGKTIEAGLIWTELRARENAKKLLILCPAVLKSKWKDELNTRFGVKADICDSSELLDKLRDSPKAPKEFAIIASIQGTRPTKGWEEDEAIQTKSANLARYIRDNPSSDPLFDCVIVDEAHHMRNPKTQTHKFGCMIREVSKYIILLSATPIQLKSDDLYYLLNIIDKSTFEFKESFDEVLRANQPLLELASKLRAKTCTQNQVSQSINDCLKHPKLQSNRQLNELKSNPPCDKLLNDLTYRVKLADRVERFNLLASVINRTRKRDVGLDRVIRVPHAQQIQMTEIEHIFYESVTERVSHYCDQYDLFQGFILTIPQKQMCSSMAASVRSWRNKRDTYDDESEEILTGIFDDISEENSSDSTDKSKKVYGELVSELRQLAHEIGDYEALKENDSKYKSLLVIIKNYWQVHPKGKIILFSYFRETLRYLEERLACDEINSVVLMGGMNKEKDRIIDDFKNSTKINIILASEALSEGVDLQFSSALINYDLPWNPMRIEQRIGRIDRIGQKEDRILIWNLFYEDTLDERIYNRLYSRLDIFKNALGDIEAILGEKIKQLNYQMFSHKLTEQEKNQRIEQTAYAIENEKYHQNSLEDEAAGLVAHGDYILEKVTAAKEMRRFIDGQNLWVYVRDFINRTYRGSNLVEKEKEPLSIDIELSIDAKTSFRQFFDNTANQFSTKLCEMNSGDPIRCIFDNRVDFKQNDYEVVNQHHPLIRFAANNTSLEDFHRVVATKIEIPKHLDLARGVYLSITKSWRTSGAKKIENLVYRGINISTGEIISEKNSELLVMLAASEGKNWHTAVSDIDPNKSIACYHQLESLIDEQFDEYCQQMKLENEDRIDYLIATLNDRMDEKIASNEQAIKTLQADNNIKMIPLFEGKIKNIENIKEMRAYEYNQKRAINSEPIDISVGVIHVQ